MQIPSADLSVLRPGGPSAPTRAAAHASWRRHAFAVTRAACTALGFVMPKACLRQDVSEGDEGETFMHQK
jgi:hypothetical protein